MRDALSVLDQCLSFGEGPLTAARVREVLGLVSDDAFGAILDLVADRRPGDVFATVDALTDAGADLVELAGGLGELLRAVLMAHYQAPLGTLPESTVALVERIRTRVAPEDVVRMLKLLGEAEQPLRRSANPRLVFETLLLRWALMDRAADLKALLEGQAPAAAEAPAPYTPPPQPTITPSQGPTSAPVYAVPWTDAALGAIWPEVVEAARRQSPFLAEALEQARPAVAGDGALALRFGPEQAVLREGVERQLAAVTAMVSARAGREVEVQVGGEAAAPVGAAKGARLSVEQLRHERLGQLRRRDPALDAAADALDLELLDDG
jgi:DNA polymerase-3 subunit gamma/tau